jgi:hypothetical protein
MVMMILKSSTTIKCTSNATHFDSQADAPVQYRVHHLMEGSMANPEATRHCHRVSIHVVLPQRLPGQQQTKQQSKKCTIIASRFDSRADAPVQYCVHHPIEVVQGFD